MGRRKPTFYVTQLRRLEKRAASSGKTALKRKAQKALSTKGTKTMQGLKYGKSTRSNKYSSGSAGAVVRKADGKTSRGKPPNVFNRLNTKMKDWRREESDDGSEYDEDEDEDEDGDVSMGGGEGEEDEAGNQPVSSRKLMKSLEGAASLRGAALFSAATGVDMVTALTGASAAVEEGADSRGNRNREAENTRRQHYRELRKVLNQSDVILQVLDARDPESCRDRGIEREILATRGKKLILILNKVDLVPKEAAEAWQRRLAAEFPCLPFKSALAQAGGRIHREGAGGNNSALSASDGLMGAAGAVLGGDKLLQWLKNYARVEGAPALRNKRKGKTAGGRGSTAVKRALTVGVVGYPNVGKSSVINSLKKASVVKVGGTAGVTRAMQEIVLDSQLRLLDSPGVVFSGKSEDASVVLRNAVKVEALKDPARVVEELVGTGKVSLGSLASHFFDCEEGGNPFANCRDFLLRIAATRGHLRKGGAPDVPRAAVFVLTDIAQGKFGYHTLPPVIEDLDGEEIGEAKIVDGQQDGNTSNFLNNLLRETGN